MRGIIKVEKFFGGMPSWLLPTIRIRDISFGMTLSTDIAGATIPDLNRVVDARLLQTAIAGR